MTLLVKSVGEVKSPGREYLKFNVSDSVPMQWEVFFSFVLDLNIPSLFSTDSGMFRQQHGLLGD